MLQILARALFDSDVVKTHRGARTEYKDCFAASEAVSFIVYSDIAATRSSAVELGQQPGLLTQGVPGVPQDPLTPPSGPRAPSPDSLKRTENPPGTP